MHIYFASFPVKSAIEVTHMGIKEIDDNDANFKLKIGNDMILYLTEKELSTLMDKCAFAWQDWKVETSKKELTK